MEPVSPFIWLVMIFIIVVVWSVIRDAIEKERLTQEIEYWKQQEEEDFNDFK